MAACVAEACSGKGTALLEAGTGTGKTFAYLVPLLQLGIRTVVSTSTRGLQDQLFARDLPALQKALAKPVATRLLKGRSNYICKQRLQDALQQQELELEGSGSEARRRSELERIAAHEENSADGDTAGVRGISQASPVWRLATSTSDNCLRRECDFFRNCHLYRARSNALSGEVIVVNHSVVFSDMVLREEGGTALLPDYDAVVFDEAHELPDMLIQNLAESVDSKAVKAEVEQFLAGSQDDAQSEEHQAAAAVSQCCANLAESVPLSWPASLTLAEAVGNEGFLHALVRLRDALEDLHVASAAKYGEQDGMGEGLAQYAERRARLLHDAIDGSASALAWVEITKKRVCLRSAPENVSELFAQQVLAGRAAIFTSASMSVDGSFEGFRARLGIGPARESRWESPFDFQGNSRLLLQPQLPDPSREREEFDTAVASVAADLCRASRGRAFVLLSSRRAMDLAGKKLRRALGREYEVLVQGQAPPAILLKSFLRDGGPPKVLVGTRTFWQGVDIRGAALSLVVIDRIPFQSPGDPILNLLSQRLPDGPERMFEMLQLPHAATLLKQAAGRLLRSESDCGVLAICDPRLLQKGYGAKILASLPPMPQIGRLDEAAQFLRQLPS